MQPFLFTMGKTAKQQACKDNMLKRMGLSVVFFLLSILLLGYIFRLPLIQWAIAPQLVKSGITLSCLDVSLTTKLDLHAEKLCLSYQNQHLELRGITANTQQLIIEQAQLTSNPLPDTGSENSAAKILDLALPDKRPLVRINQLTISNDNLRKPITVRVVEGALNQFTVTGDINAKLSVSNHQITGQLLLDDKLLSQLLNTATTPLSDLQFSSKHNVNFDGVELSVTSDINAQFVQQHQQCTLTVKSAGVANTLVNLNSQAVSLDLSPLASEIELAPSCSELLPESEYKAFLVKQMPLQMQVKLTEVVTILNDRLKVPMLVFDTAADAQFSLTLTQAELDLAEPLSSFSSALNAQLASANIERLTLNASIADSHIAGSYSIILASLPEFIEVSASGVQASGEFNIANIISTKPSGAISSRITADNVALEPLYAKDYQGNLTAKIDENLNAKVSLDSKLKALNYNEFTLSEITNKVTAAANLAAGELFADITAQSHIKALKSPNIKLNNITVDSTALQSRALSATHHAVVNNLELLITHNMSAVAHPFEVVIPQQSALRLNPVIHQFVPLGQLTAGVFDGRITGDVGLQSAAFEVNIKNVSALYNDYLASDLSSRFSGNYYSGLLNVKATTFNLSELRAGAVVNNISGVWQVNDNKASAKDIRGQIFGGRFSVDQYALLKAEQVANVHFTDVDASKLISLDDKSGIFLTGRVGGVLPVHFNDTGIEIANGSLTNQGDGKLIISNNAAFDAVMQQQQELQPVLGLLTNLEIKKLNSKVALKNDGWLKLGVNLQGYNEKEQQQVNFNYNHEENIFTLLRALRLSDEITQKVEQQYSKRGNE